MSISLNIPSQSLILWQTETGERESSEDEEDAQQQKGSKARWMQ
jgi:hypothetical protein